MRSLTDWAATLRHSHSSFSDDLRDEIDQHNERIVGLIRAEGFKAGQEAMRERAANVCPERTGHEWVRESLWGRVAERMKHLILALPIE